MIKISPRLQCTSARSYNHVLWILVWYQHFLLLFSVILTWTIIVFCRGFLPHNRIVFASTEYCRNNTQHQTITRAFWLQSLREPKFPRRILVKKRGFACLFSLGFPPGIFPTTVELFVTSSFYRWDAKKQAGWTRLFFCDQAALRRYSRLKNQSASIDSSRPAGFFFVREQPKKKKPAGWG